MTHRTLLRGALALAVTLLLPATAHAQLFRAYLASTGNDGNPCTLVAPCRLLPTALAAVADGGEIWMLDSANYNNAPVNIAKSVTILAVPGALGSVLATGGNALDISGSGIRVALRNLVIGPLPGGGGNHGIVMTYGDRLMVEDCIIANLPGDGIFVNYPLSLRITDTTIRDNGVWGVVISEGARGTITRSAISGNNNGGIFVAASGGGTLSTADIADSTLVANRGSAVWLRSTNATGVIRVSIHGSLLAQNAGEAGAAVSDAGAAVTLSVSDNLLANNGTGVAAQGAGSKAWASGNTIVGSGAGMRAYPGGVVESAGNNAVRNNTADTSGTITVVATK